MIRNLEIMETKNGRQYIVKANYIGGITFHCISDNSGDISLTEGFIEALLDNAAYIRQKLEKK